MHAGLGHDVCLHGHAGHPRAGAQRHLYRVQLLLHILDEASAEQRRAHPRQGVRDGTGREPVQPKPLDELHHGVYLLDKLDALCGR